MLLNVSSISLEWPSTGVFKAGRPSSLWTDAHLLRMSPAVSVFALPVNTSSSYTYFVMKNANDHTITAQHLIKIDRFVVENWSLLVWPRKSCNTVKLCHKIDFYRVIKIGWQTKFPIVLFIVIYSGPLVPCRVLLFLFLFFWNVFTVRAAMQAMLAQSWKL